jgi:hypothetical protein
MAPSVLFNPSLDIIRRNQARDIDRNRFVMDDDGGF